MEKIPCPRCGCKKEFACPKCGWIKSGKFGEWVTAIPMHIRQCYELPYNRRHTSDYDGPCPVCGLKIKENRCTGCDFVGNFFAIKAIVGASNNMVTMQISAQVRSARHFLGGGIIMTQERNLVYGGPCPACGADAVDNKCTACFYFGNLVAVRTIFDNHISVQNTALLYTKAEQRGDSLWKGICPECKIGLIDDHLTRGLSCWRCGRRY